MIIKYLVLKNKNEILKLKVKIKHLKNEFDSSVLPDYFDRTTDKLTSDKYFKTLYELKRLKIKLKKKQAFVSYFEKEII